MGAQFKGTLPSPLRANAGPSGLQPISQNRTFVQVVPNDRFQPIADISDSCQFEATV
jgi:hypothetical protein